MDDNKENQQKNQPFETVVIEDQPKETPTSGNSLPDQNLVPEEVAPDVSSPEESISSGSNLPPEAPPVFEENKNQPLLIVGAVIVFFIVFIFIFRLIFSSKKNSQPVTLNYWGLWEEKEVFEPLIAEYQKKYPYVKINYQKMEPDNYREKLLVRSRNNQGPDIFRFHNTWLPEIKEIASAIPSSIMSNAEFEKTFYKIHQKDLKVGDKYFGLPLEIDGLVLIYNVNLLKKAGIDKPPETWDELLEVVPKLTVKDVNGNIITAGIALGLTVNVDHFSDILALMIYQNGGDIKKLDSEEAAGALESYRKFAEPPNNFWDENMPNSLTAFIQEKVAMILAPSWHILTIKSTNPEIEVKAVPVPSLPGASPISIANYWVEGVSKMSRNQIEAWRFLRFLVEKDNLTKMYELASRNRLFGEPYSRVDLAPLLVQNNYLGAVIKQADYFVSVPAISRTFDNGLNDEIVKYLENAINATIEGVSYNEALITAKKGVDQVLQKYRL
jgi:ABC-type sugar transport system, periplasmic component